MYKTIALLFFLIFTSCATNNRFNIITYDKYKDLPGEIRYCVVENYDPNIIYEYIFYEQPKIRIVNNQSFSIKLNKYRFPIKLYILSNSIGKYNLKSKFIREYKTIKDVKKDNVYFLNSIKLDIITNGKRDKSDTLNISMDYDVKEISIIFSGDILNLDSKDLVYITKRIKITNNSIQLNLETILTEQEINQIIYNKSKLSIRVDSYDKNGDIISSSEMKEY